MTCPICSKASQPRYRPFCSRRCADVDLGRWLNENYRVPDLNEDPDDVAETAAEASAENLH